MAKLRMTVFTRFLLFMIIFIPIAFIGVNMAQGNDPLQEFNQLIGRTSSTSKKETARTKTSEEMTIELLRAEVQTLKTELEICKQSSK